MTEIQKPRRSRGLKSMSVAAVSGAAVIGMVLSAAPASAGVESSNSVVDSDGNTITVSLSDTFINGVPSLDGNPLTREWFANGKASYTVTGPKADDFAGNMKIGYQVGYPLSLNGTVTIAWASPSANLALNAGNTSTVTNTGTVGSILANPGGFATGAAVTGTGTSGTGLTSNVQLIPQASASIALSNGPGIIQSEGPVLRIGPDDTSSADTTGSKLDKSGSSGSIQVSNLDGTATGILGNVSIRPYVTLTSATGDTVATYGVPVRLN